MALGDYGQPGDPLSSPSLSEWAASVASEVAGKAAAGHGHTGYADAGHGHTGYAPTVHDHDDRYYTEAEADAGFVWTAADSPTNPISLALLTQAQYDALPTKDADTVYVIR